MKCRGGALLTAGRACLLNTGRVFDKFDSWNALRLQLLKEPALPELDWEDFGRGADSVRQIMLCAALTALDAPETPWSRCAVIGWNGDGCGAENQRYFDDYLASGRSGGRGSLFVPTLPSIPFCEAAIMLKCHGCGGYFATAASTAALAGILPEGIFLLGSITEAYSALMLWENEDQNGALPEAADLKMLFEKVCRR